MVLATPPLYRCIALVMPYRPCIGALRWQCRTTLVSVHCADNRRATLVSVHCADNRRAALISGLSAGDVHYVVVSGK
jgi:hypothetical protein